jgi:hypothetical protein
MNIFGASIIAFAAILLAAALERLLRQYHRKLIDDCTRIEAAQTALKEQQQRIDNIIGHKIIPSAVKIFVVELSEVIPNKKIAYKVAEWIDAGMPHDNDEADDETDRFFDDLRTLSKSNQEAFELVTSALRGAFVTMMLQWPATTRCMQRLAYKLAVESTSEVAKSAIAVRRAARHHHWIDTDQAVPA